VARSLEREWNEELAEVERLERESVALPARTLRPAGPEDRQRILDLAQDLPTVWYSATTTNAERKQLLRFLIKDVALTRRETIVEVAILWQTGAPTTCSLPRLKKTWEECQTDPRAMALVGRLTPGHTDQQIATHLNETGLNAGCLTSPLRYLDAAHWSRSIRPTLELRQ
jgi:hypothetical protein